MINEVLTRDVSVYSGVPVSIPELPESTTWTNIEITETNSINPHLFLDNHDITFIGAPQNVVIFSEKNTFRYPGSVHIPYHHIDPGGQVQFPCKIGNGVTDVIVDTGSSGANNSFVVNDDVAYELGITRYPRIRFPGFTSYMVPVEILNTAITFICPIMIQPDEFYQQSQFKVLITGEALLSRGFGFTIRDTGYDFFKVAKESVDIGSVTSHW
jgi:hypothetical protein